jgi:hypothetical protein
MERITAGDVFHCYSGKGLHSPMELRSELRVKLEEIVII